MEQEITIPMVAGLMLISTLFGLWFGHKISKSKKLK